MTMMMIILFLMQPGKCVRLALQVGAPSLAPQALARPIEYQIPIKRADSRRSRFKAAKRPFSVLYLFGFQIGSGRPRGSRPYFVHIPLQLPQP